LCFADTHSVKQIYSETNIHADNKGKNSNTPANETVNR